MRNMALDKRKIEAIELLVSGEKVSNIATLVGVSRKTIYNWLEDVEFKAELNALTHDIKEQGRSRITNKLDNYLEELERIALTSDSEKTRADALQYLINRVLGSPVAINKIETDEDNAANKNVSTEDLREEFKKFKVIGSKVANKNSK